MLNVPAVTGGDTAQPAMATLDDTAAGHGKSAYGPECWRLQTRMSPKRGLRDVGYVSTTARGKTFDKLATTSTAAAGVTRIDF